MSSRILTVGIASYKEGDSIWFTIRDLRLHHGYGFDILVLDNAPESCQRTKDITLSAGGTYLHRPDKTGTTESRGELFRQGKTPWQMVCDAHVLFSPGAIQAAIEYAVAHPDSNDLIQGPIVWDDDQTTPTHWRQTTPPGLWGVWDVDRRVTEGKPFEIPMMGLGCWMMRRDAWPGFNPFYRGFGGEEGYIHERVRRFGAKCICLPQLKWSHLFREKGKAPYKLFPADHIHNLMVGHRELGIDATEAIRRDMDKQVKNFDELVKQAEHEQPFGELRPMPRKRRILGVWYSNNSAPEELLKHSLTTIADAVEQSWHDVHIMTCPWKPIPDNPFYEVLAKKEAKPGHAQIIEQIEWCVQNANGRWGGVPEAIVFLEHDVLYAPGHFDRIGDALNLWPNAEVFSNLDYMGLDEKGWQAVKERHEPLHQLAMTPNMFAHNMLRAKADCDRQGWCLLEPQGDRSKWIRFAVRGLTPNVHVGHKQGRFTSHHEVVFANKFAPTHPFWGKASDWWVSDKPVTKEMDMTFNSMEEYYQKVKQLPCDFDQHMDTVRRLADECQVVAELSTWLKPGLIALAASKAKAVMSFTSGEKPAWKEIRKFRPDFIGFGAVEYLTQEIPPRDLLFIDTGHRASELGPLLDRYAPETTKYLVVHCTETFGERGDDGTEGVNVAIDAFLEKNADWKKSFHDWRQNGLTVLSRNGTPMPLAKVPRADIGPGTELKKLLASLGITDLAGCNCKERMVQMNLWGVKKCRDRIDEIVGWMKAGQVKWGWVAKMKAKLLAVGTGLAFKLNPLDPFPGLIEEAIRRAEAQDNP